MGLSSKNLDVYLDAFQTICKEQDQHGEDVLSLARRGIYYILAHQKLSRDVNNELQLKTIIDRCNYLLDRIHSYASENVGTVFTYDGKKTITDLVEIGNICTSPNTFYMIKSRKLPLNTDGIGDVSTTVPKVRRPIMGIIPKANTYAALSIHKVAVYGEKNTEAKTNLYDATARNITGETAFKTDKYTNFIIQSMQETHQEIHQLVQTFDHAYSFFYGERPQTVAVSGVLVNSINFNWRSEFMKNYHEVLRGSIAVGGGNLVRLTYDGRILHGYLLNLQVSESADNNAVVNFSFSMIISKYYVIEAATEAARARDAAMFRIIDKDGEPVEQINPHEYMGKRGPADPDNSYMPKVPVGYQTLQQGIAGLVGLNMRTVNRIISAGPIVNASTAGMLAVGAANLVVRKDSDKSMFWEMDKCGSN